MPWRAMSIIPFDDAAPIKTPIEATIRMVRNGAALEPIAELRKLTASLLTPTERSKIARMKRKMMIPKNIVSMLLLFVAKLWEDCFKNISWSLKFCCRKGRSRAFGRVARRGALALNSFTLTEV